MFELEAMADCGQLPCDKELWAETAALGLRVQESVTFGASQHEVTWIRIMDFRIWKDLGTIWMAFGEFPIGLRASIYRVHPFQKILCGASIVVIPSGQA
jgi:hypothetical protein